MYGSISFFTYFIASSIVATAKNSIPFSSSILGNSSNPNPYPLFFNVAIIGVLVIDFNLFKLSIIYIKIIKLQIMV